MQYKPIINPSIIAFFLTFHPSINAVCPAGEIALGSIKTCFSPRDVPSCDKFLNPEAGAILTNDCSVIDISSEEDLCEGGWTPLIGDVKCVDYTPVWVETPAAYFANCYESKIVDDPPCQIPTIKKPFAFTVRYCCERYDNKVWHKN